MLREFLGSSQPEKKTVLIKASILFIIISTVLIGQFLLPRETLPRAKNYTSFDSQILGALSIPTPAPPLERLKASIDQKVVTFKESIASRGATLQNDMSILLKTKTANTRSTFEKIVVSLYLKGIDKSLPNLLPEDKKAVLEKISELSASPTASPTAFPSIFPTF